jgi:mRNA interferase MazF
MLASLVTLVPHTTSLRGSRFEVETKVVFLVPGAFDAQNLVTVPFARLVRSIGQLEPHELASVERRDSSQMRTADWSPLASSHE